MGNLNRQINKHLLNSVVAGDVPAKTDPKTSRPLFIHTGLGLALIGNVANEANPPMHVNIKPGKAGTKKVTTLTLTGNYNSSIPEYEFAVTITRKAKMNGWSNELRDIQKTYNYVKKSFTTVNGGAWNEADAADILSTLADRINADKQLGDNHVLTGACVVAAYVPMGEDHLTNAYITLTAKDASLNFTVDVDTQLFSKDTLGTPVVGVKPAGTTDDIARIFSVKPDQAGTIPPTPLADTIYTEIEITYRNEGYDNTSASAFNVREQKEVIYVPNGYADALADDLVAALKTAALTVYKDGVEWTA